MSHSLQTRVRFLHSRIGGSRRGDPLRNPLVVWREITHMGFLDQIEEVLREEGINYRRVEQAVLASFRDGDVSYNIIVLADDEMTVIVGRTDPPLIPTAEMARKLLEENFRMNFASYQLSEDNEVIVTSFLRSECIGESFRRNFYITLAFLRKLGESLAS